MAKRSEKKVATQEIDQRGQIATTTDQNEEDRDLRQSQGTDNRTLKEEEETLITPEPKDKESSASDYEERIKHERRERRCPIVAIERHLNNGGSEDEGKEEGGTTRKHR